MELENLVVNVCDVASMGSHSLGVESENLVINVCVMSMFVVEGVKFFSCGMKSESLVVNVCFFNMTEL